MGTNTTPGDGVGSEAVIVEKEVTFDFNGPSAGLAEFDLRGDYEAEVDLSDGRMQIKKRL